MTDNANILNELFTWLHFHSSEYNEGVTLLLKYQADIDVQSLHILNSGKSIVSERILIDGIERMITKHSANLSEYKPPEATRQTIDTSCIKVNASSIFELWQRRQNLYSYVSRNRKVLNKRPYVMAKINAHLLEIYQISNLLKHHKQALKKITTKK
jgi:hypothetical protein